MVLSFVFFCNLRRILGEVAEWSKAHAWKACILSESVSRVRIPPSPQKFVTIIYRKTFNTDKITN